MVLVVLVVVLQLLLLQLLLLQLRVLLKLPSPLGGAASLNGELVPRMRLSSDAPESKKQIVLASQNP